MLAEMLWDPQAEIYDIVRALARTKRVFNIHLRNIKGRRDNFQEVWADEGDINRLIEQLSEDDLRELLAELEGQPGEDELDAADS